MNLKKITIIDVIRDNKTKHIEFDYGKYTDFKILKLMMEVAEGIV